MAVGDKLVNTDHARAMYQILDGKIGDLKSAVINDVLRYKGQKIEFDATDKYIACNGSKGNHIATTTPKDNKTGYRCALIPCEPGDTFELNLTYNENEARVYAFLDAGDNITAVSGKNVNASGLYAAPPGTAKLIVNDYYVNNPGSVYKYLGTNLVGSVRSAVMSLGKSGTIPADTWSQGYVDPSTGSGSSNDYSCRSTTGIAMPDGKGVYIVMPKTGYALAARRTTSGSAAMITDFTSEPFVIRAEEGDLFRFCICRTDGAVLRPYGSAIAAGEYELEEDAASYTAISSDITSAEKRLSEIESAFSNDVLGTYKNLEYIDFGCYAGGITASSGGNLDNNARARTKFFSVVPNQAYYISLDSDVYTFAVVWLYKRNDTSGALRRIDKEYDRNHVAFTTTGEEIYCRMSFYYDSDREHVMTAEDFAAINNALHVYKAEDAMLSVPPYYISHLQEKIALARTNMENAGRHGFSFIFFTDPHWENNNRHSPALMRYIMDRLHVNDVICGGDMITEGEKATMISDMYDCINAFKKAGITFPSAVGNHDRNWNSSKNGQRTADGGTRRFTDDEVWASMFAQYDKRTMIFWDEANGFNFYIDYPETNTRVIFVDTGDSDDEQNKVIWTNYNNYCNILKESADHNMIVVAHAVNDSYNGEKLARIADKFNKRASGTITEKSLNITVDFSDVGSAKIGKVYAVIGGHGHPGATGNLSDCGITWFDRPTDSVIQYETRYWASGYDPENDPTGTINEQSFDIVTINYDPENPKVSFVKIGRGTDEEFTPTVS